MNIRLVNANLGKADTIETDVATWGELQTLPEVQEFLSGDTQAVIRETQNSLSVDQAELPTEKLSGEDKDYDYTLFFITKKSKAGSEDYDSWSFNQLRAECASRDSIEGNGGNYGSTEHMIELLEEDDARQAEESGDVQEEEPAQVPGGTAQDQLDRIESKVDQVLGYFEDAEARALEDQNVEDASEEQNAITEEERSAYDTIASQV